MGGARQFQSAPPRGGDGKVIWIITEADRFNPRPRVGAMTIEMGSGTFPSLFQSAPPRGGDSTTMRQRPMHWVVSIRAPAWGRCREGAKDESDRQFQSAPPRGGDGSRKSNKMIAKSFNPRPRVGAMLGTARFLVASLFQSAPPRGGDSVQRSSVRCSSCFNPRPRVGAMRGNRAAGLAGLSFNPRPRVGAICMSDAPANFSVCFNPRPRVGAM